MKPFIVSIDAKASVVEMPEGCTRSLVFCHEVFCLNGTDLYCPAYSHLVEGKRLRISTFKSSKSALVFITPLATRAPAKPTTERPHLNG